MGYKQSMAHAQLGAPLRGDSDLARLHSKTHGQRNYGVYHLRPSCVKHGLLEKHDPTCCQCDTTNARSRTVQQKQTPYVSMSIGFFPETTKHLRVPVTTIMLMIRARSYPCPNMLYAPPSYLHRTRFAIKATRAVCSSRKYGQLLCAQQDPCSCDLSER